MKKFKNILILLLILLPICTLVFKSQFLNISLVPKANTDSWVLELSYDEVKDIPNDPLKLDKNFKLPVPKTSHSQKVTYLKISPESKENNLGSENSSNAESKDKVLTAHVKTFGQKQIQPPTDKKLNKLELRKFLSLPELNEETLSQLNTISTSIVFETDTDIEKLKKIFFYISDELILQPNNDELDDVLTLKSGSYLGQARLLTALAKINKIPARIAFGIQILEPTPKDTNRYIRVLYSEAFIEGRWVPINPHQKDFGVLKDDFIVLDKDAGEHAQVYNDRNLFSIYIKPLSFRAFNSKSFLKKMKEKHVFWSYISLHRFPISIQSIFFGLLLIPFGTVILSFMRVVVGVETFGIFTPILLTLFFLETSLAYGLSFFILVVLLGLSQRALLDKFYLLAVPRLSVLLALVILMYTGYAILMNNFGLLANSAQDSLSYFPIVIITVFIERFSIYFIEEGGLNTLKRSLGTFAVSIMCYLLLSVTSLKSLLFNNPELLLLAIGLNLALGSYKGYRLLEFLRFSDIESDEEAPGV